MGGPGPDRGEGGQYLILPPGFDGTAPEGYFTSQSTSYINFVALRGFQVDGSPAAASNKFRDGVKIYPLSRREDPPAMAFINASAASFDTIHANTIEFYDEVHSVIDREPVDMVDPETRGLLASIGIRKGQPFEPDEQNRATLTDAIAVANATARALYFKMPDGDDFLYEGSKWKCGFFGGNYQFLLGDGEGGERNLDARTRFFYMATLNTPAMAAKMIGKGSQYAWGDHDSDGNYLDGAKDYRLNLPANPPANNFWSIVVYDPQTRSERQTPGRPSRVGTALRVTSSRTPTAPSTLYMGPEAPKGRETNWIQTVPGKGWFCAPPPLRPARALVRQDLGSRRHRTARRRVGGSRRPSDRRERLMAGAFGGGCWPLRRCDRRADRPAFQDQSA